EESRHGFQYQSCYCEENVYLMGKEMANHRPIDEFHVIFVSNSTRSVLLTNQLANENGTVCWDYHVILLHTNANSSLVYDLDSRLAFPVAATEYIIESFPRQVRSELAPIFRLIPLSSYLSFFSSDRSHMLSPLGSYLSPPPPWPPISSSEALSSNEIDSFISMNSLVLPRISQILSLHQMLKFVTTGCYE
ncbi:hypothetical protein PFISCL1PPCAC_19934, partial [Pristionchus fissidentatus]